MVSGESISSREINGSRAIRTSYNDNPAAFITWGSPANFKMSVGNSSLARALCVRVPEE